ncbi:MAG: nitrous oxide reductase accessory protein NosL [Chloroflexota bacterium]
MFLLVFSALILLTVTACAGSASADPAPPVIHYGEDMCDLCGMIISDERFAAGYITREGQDYIFDDMGNMFRHHLQNQAEVAAFFVHNYDDKAWIRAETAAYVLSPHLPTPMLSGLAAFDSAGKAKTLAVEKQGRVMTFAEVLAYYQTNPMPSGEHSMEHDQ